MSVTAESAPADAIRRSKAIDAVYVASRLILAILAGVSAVLLGLVTGSFIAGHMPNDLTDPNVFAFQVLGYPVKTPFSRGWVATVLGVTNTGLFIKWCLDVVSTLPVFWEPLENAWKNGLSTKAKQAGDFARTVHAATLGNWKTLSLLWVTATTLALSSSLWDPNAKKHAPPAGQQTPATPGEVLPHEMVTRRFLVYFEENSSVALKKWDFRSGLRFVDDASTRTILRVFAQRLAYCNRDGVSAQVLIKGYASSSGDDAQNQALATERARFVVNYLYTIVTDSADTDAESRPLPPLGQTEYSAHVWQTFAEMEKERGFADRIDGRYSSKRGQLNRRVEIEVTDAAGCKAP